MKYAFIAALCLFAQPATAQPLRVAQAIGIKERASTTDAFAARAEWNALTFYLQGSVETAVAYQKTQETNGSKPLFCPPKQNSASLEDIFTVLERAKGPERQRSAVELILASYAEKYPCDK